MASPIFDRIQDMRDVSLTSIAARHTLRWNGSAFVNTSALVGSTRAFDPRDFGAVAGSAFDASLPSSGTMTANATAIQAAIDAAAAADGWVVLTEFYWSDAGLTCTVPMQGLGFHTGIGTPALSGTLLDMRVSTGYAIAPLDMTLSGPWASAPDFGGSTTFTTILLHVGNASAAAMHLRLERVQALGGYTGVKLTNATWARVAGCVIQHARGEGILVNVPISSDAGDTKIDDNWIHVANVGSPGYAAGTTTGIRVTSCAGLRIRGNKFYCQSDTAIDVNLSEASYGDGGSVVQIAHHITGNDFDSGATVAGSTCIRYRFGGAAVTGNTLRDLTVADNLMSNCVDLVDIDGSTSKLEDLTIQNNRGSGGGGIALAGTITRAKISENHFNADGAGTAPAKPITSTATIGTVVAHDNTFTGYSDDPDIADTGGGTSTDLTEAQVELTPATGTVTIPVNTGGFTNTYSEIGEAQNITFDVSGADAVVDGARGVHSLHYTGTSGAPTVVAPSGFTVVTAASGATFPTAADDLLVDIHWYIKGTRIRIEKVVSYGTVAGLTTEGGGGGATIFEDSFDTGSGTISGRTPDVTAGPNNWALEGLFAVDGAGNYAYAEVEATNNGGVYDTESADGIFTVTVNCPSTVIGAFISVNHDSFTNNWQLWWRVDTGTTTLYKVVGGSFTSVASTTLTWTADTDYEIAITVDGDDITVSRDGVAIGALDWNESSRPLKTNTKVSIMNGSAGIVKFKDAKFESLPA